MVTALTLLAIVLVVIGLAGTVLPILPGVPLIFGGLLLLAYQDGFTKVGVITLVILGGLTVLAVLIDYIAGILGAKRVGASRLAIIGATVGTLVGLFLGFIGLILGPFVGAAAGEFIARQDAMQAGKVGLATWLGMVIGVAAKLGIAFLMVGIFVTSYFFND
ncbi:MAG: DUF456 domain-containing protein [Burkholderiales bacterium]